MGGTTQGSMQTIPPSLVGLPCFFLSVFLLNYAVFPACRQTAYHSPDIGSFIGVLFLVGLAACLYRAPHRLPTRALNAAASVCAILQAPIGIVGFEAGIPALTVICALLGCLASEWCCMCVSLSACSLGERHIAPATFAALFCAYLLGGLCVHVSPVWAAFVLQGLGLIAGILSCKNEAGRCLASDSGPAPRDSTLTSPLSYLPFTSGLFVILALAQVVFGFSMTTTGTAQFCLPSLAALFLIVAWIAIAPRADMDALFGSLTVIAVASLVLSTPVESVLPGFGSFVSSLGAAGMSAFALCALVCAAQRNMRGAPTVIAWGNALSSASIVIGAMLGYLTWNIGADNAALREIVPPALGVAVVAASLFGMKTFSFHDVVTSIANDTPPVQNEPSRSMDAQCQDIATLYRLTPRELDVLLLLARGRNSAVIQTELGIARNTVKIHVGHIYAKLGIHSQQELIDLVEQEPQSEHGAQAHVPTPNS